MLNLKRRNVFFKLDDIWSKCNKTNLTGQKSIVLY